MDSKINENEFRKANTLLGNSPEDLRRTIAEHERRIDAQNELIEHQYNTIAKKEEELKELKIRYQEAIIEKKQPNSEIKILKDEIKRLSLPRPNVEDSWIKIFSALESISLKTAIILSRDAMDEEGRELSRELKSRPELLRSLIAMQEKSHKDGYQELIELIERAASLLGKRKRGLPESRRDHRAKLLLNCLSRLDSLSTSQAINILAVDEDSTPNRLIALRAMKRAAELEPGKADFLPGTKGGLRSRLIKRNCGD